MKSKIYGFVLVLVLLVTSLQLSTVFAASAQVVVDSNSYLNLRSGPSTSYSSILRLSNGTQVEIIDYTSSSWAKVQYGSQVGYVSRSYIREINTSSSGSANAVSGSHSPLLSFPFPAYSLKGSFGGKHKGIDIVPATGSSWNVLSAGSGQVVYKWNGCSHISSNSCICNKGTGFGMYGNCVLIYHPDLNIYSFYAHLELNSILVSVGEYVFTGQMIAKMGSSGDSRAPHLHFETRSGSWPSTAYSELRAFNPMNYVQ